MKAIYVNQYGGLDALEYGDQPDPVAQAAAAWMLRHDRGLTAAEQDEFSQWLAADPRPRSTRPRMWLIFRSRARTRSASLA